MAPRTTSPAMPQRTEIMMVLTRMDSSGDSTVMEALVGVLLDVLLVDVEVALDEKDEAVFA